MKQTLKFLNDLSKNNNREWFNANKDRYKEAEDEFKNLVSEVEQHINEHDSLDPSGTKIFRIYKDVRFSKDKTPYNTHRSSSFKREGATRRGGYYFSVSPGKSILAGGFWGPDPADLLHIRKQLQGEGDTLRKIFNQKEYTSYFNGLEGDQVKTSPKGFDKEDPAIDLIRYKQFMVTHKFSDKEVASSDFAVQLSDGFKKMRPFFDFMSDILTTDLNGASLV